MLAHRTQTQYILSLILQVPAIGQMMNITIIGFGEAGPVFGKQFLDQGMTVTAWDKRQADPDTAEPQIEKTQALGIKAAASMHEAVRSADLIVSTVTASQAIVAAQQAIDGLREGSHWFDLNSVSPATKQAVHDLVTSKGVLFTEGVAMDTVPAKGIQVPILLCGPQSQSLCDQLNTAGLNTRSVSNELGAASTTKLLRSILIKGMESLFAESMEAAAKVGVQDEVVASLQATYPGIDWQDAAPIMAAAIAARQQNLSDRDVASHFEASNPPTIADYVDAIAQS